MTIYTEEINTKSGKEKELVYELQSQRRCHRRVRECFACARSERSGHDQVVMTAQINSANGRNSALYLQ